MKKKHFFYISATNEVAPAAPRSVWGKTCNTMGGKTTNASIIENKNEKENKNG